MNAIEMNQLLMELGACESALTWADGKTLTEIWEQCERADWLLWLIGCMEGKEGWPERKAIVLAACDCAELALPYVKVGEDGPRIAIETAQAWTRGEASLEDIREACNDACAAACDTLAGAAAAYAADNAVAAACAAADSKEIRAKCLAIVRERLTPAILKAVSQ